MAETEWMLYCPNGHRFYQKLRDIFVPDLDDGTMTFSDCPTCGAPRRGERLPPVR